MSYKRVNWEDAPSEKTPINAENLNNMDAGIKELENGLMDGTLQVRNAKTLDGHGAEEFAMVEEFKSFKGSNKITTSILEFALTIPNDETYNCSLAGSAYTATDLPDGASSAYRFSTATITGYTNNKIVILWGFDNHLPVINGYRPSSGWYGWRTLASTADLANYLPLTGGTVKGDVAVGADGDVNRIFTLKNGTREIRIAVYAGGVFRIKDITNNKEIILSTNDGTNTFNGHASEDLSLKGGTVATDGTTPLRLKNNSADALYLQMLGASGVLGYFAMNGKDKPSFISTTGAVSDILHTGNVASYALPIGGGVCYGDIQVAATNTGVNAGVLALSNYIGNSYFCNRHKTSGKFRQLFIASEEFETNTENALKYEASDMAAVTVHHDGNSAKVHIYPSAPSDTSALWVDTSA